MKELAAKEVLDRMSRGEPIESCLVSERIDLSVLGGSIHKVVSITDSVFTKFEAPSIQFNEKVLLTRTVLTRKENPAV